MLCDNSSLAGLAVALCVLYNVNFEPHDLTKYSIPVRIAAGAACCTVFGGVVKWEVGFDPRDLAESHDDLMQPDLNIKKSESHYRYKNKLKNHSRDQP